MEKRQFTCDKCKISIVGDNIPSAWTMIIYNYGAYVSPGAYNTTAPVRLHFCPVCSEKLKLPMLKNKEETPETVGQQLVSLFEDLAFDVFEAQEGPA